MLAEILPGWLCDHLQEDSPAITVEVIAVEFEISLFAGRQCWFQGGVMRGTEMHTAHLALGQLGKHRMKGCHGY